MDVKTNLSTTLAAAVERVLAALFRVLLRHGMSFITFEAIAKRVYVDVALREFGIPGKKPSISRASILSGLTRKEVQRLLAESELDAHDALSNERENRAVRVLSAWTRDRDFADADGQPRVLDLQEGPTSFAALVRRHSGDMPVRAVLDELLRVGAVRRLPDGRLHLVQRAFLPQTATDKLDHLGTDVADLMHTIDHNVEHGDTDPRFQRRVMYHDIAQSAVAEFRKLSSAQAMALLVKLDRWLAIKFADYQSGGEPKEPSVRLGMGIYYFEQGLDASNSAKDSPP